MDRFTRRTILTIFFLFVLALIPEYKISANPLQLLQLHDWTINRNISYFSDENDEDNEQEDVIPVHVSPSPLIWAFQGSIFYFAANNGVDSDPAPILPSAGFSLALKLSRMFRIEFTEDIYMTNYEYNHKQGYPMACNPENRSAFVIGFITGINAVLVVPFGNNFFRFYGGPAADLRIVTLAFGLNHPNDFTGNIDFDAQLQTDAIEEYFWEKGRWFMPVAGFGFDFPLNEKFLIGFDMRTWFPVYRLWTNDDVPAIDGWRFGAGFRITILNKK